MAYETDSLVYGRTNNPYDRSCTCAPAENRHEAVEVRDIRAVRDYLEKQGAELRKAVVIPDRERFYVLEPFGNYFELIEMKSA